MNPEKYRNLSANQKPAFNSYTKIEIFSKTIFGKIKADIPVPMPHVIPEDQKQEKIDIRKARKGTHKYNIKFRVNHVITFKNSPKMFKMDVTDIAKEHIGSD